MFMNIAKYHIFIYKKRVNFCPPVFCTILFRNSLVEDLLTLFDNNRLREINKTLRVSELLTIHRNTVLSNKTSCLTV